MSEPMSEERLKEIEDYLPDETELCWRDEIIEELIAEVWRLLVDKTRLVKSEAWKKAYEDGRAVERERCIMKLGSLIDEAPERFQSESEMRWFQRPLREAIVEIGALKDEP